MVDPIEARILLFLPHGRNGELTRQILAQAQLDSTACDSMTDLLAEIESGAGSIVISDQALRHPDAARLPGLLDAQPVWSDLPVVLLTSDPDGVERHPIQRRMNAVVLARPVRPQTLVSTLRAALRARRRQYEVRDLKADLERRVEARTRQVRELAKRLAQAERRERQRISRVLHDGVQQLLFGVKMKTSVIRLNAEREGRADLVSDIDQAGEWLGEAIEMTRQLSVELSPPILSHEGFTDALGWLVVQLRQRHGLEVEVATARDVAVGDDDVSELLFQIVRELLFNVVKHAGTDQARVEIDADDVRFIVRVVDRGRGFDPARQATQTPRGLGLRSVRERLDLFGGALVVDSSPGVGTTVTVQVPASFGNRALT